jgi:hypothetical protein
LKTALCGAGRRREVRGAQTVERREGRARGLFDPPPDRLVNHFVPPFFRPDFLPPPADVLAFVVLLAARPAAFAAEPAARPADRAACPAAFPARAVVFLVCLAAEVRDAPFAPFDSFSGRSSRAAVGLTAPSRLAAVARAESATLAARVPTSPAMRPAVSRALSVAPAERSMALLAVSAEERTVLFRLRLVAI